MKITAEMAREIQANAEIKSKVRHSIFRRIKRSAKREFSSMVFYQREIKSATKVELRRRGFEVSYDDSEGYTVSWFKSLTQ